jgi:CheY-like chemotaxis protein
MTLAEASILVVDDEPVLRLTFSILLRQTGATVHVAGNGVEALEVLAREHADVILSDKQMPEMDGLTFLYKLRERGITTPAVFFVNGVVSESPTEMEQLGVAETVTKPMHPAELLKILASVLEPLPAVA